MKRDIRVYIEDILESILKIKEYTDNISEEIFFTNDQIQDAVARRLEIIGEAVKNIKEAVELYLGTLTAKEKICPMSS